MKRVKKERAPARTLDQRMERAQAQVKKLELQKQIRTLREQQKSL